VAWHSGRLQQPLVSVPAVHRRVAGLLPQLQPSRQGQQVKRSPMPKRKTALRSTEFPRAPAKPGVRVPVKKKPTRKIPWPDGTPPCLFPARGQLYGRKGSWKGEATWAHAKLIRFAGRCQYCGSTERLQCAHIMRRGFSATRTAEDNALCLCARCHRVFTIDGTKWHLALVQLLPAGKAEELYKRASNGVNQKFPEGFWHAEYLRLKAGLESLGGDLYD
jgi:hypothetical protein